MYKKLFFSDKFLWTALLTDFLCLRFYDFYVRLGAWSLLVLFLLVFFRLKKFYFLQFAHKITCISAFIVIDHSKANCTLQGTVATRLRCSKIFNDLLTFNLLRSASAKKFRKKSQAVSDAVLTKSIH